MLSVQCSRGQNAYACVRKTKGSSGRNLASLKLEGGAGNAGVVVHDLEHSEPLDGKAHEHLHISRIGHVSAPKGHRIAKRRSDGLTLRGVDVSENYPRPFSREHSSANARPIPLAAPATMAPFPASSPGTVPLLSPVPTPPDQRWPYAMACSAASAIQRPESLACS